MQFLHSFVLCGLIAVALPWLIHLIGHKKVIQAAFGAFDFLLATHDKSLGKHVLQNWLLLITRMLLITCLVLAVARLFGALAPHVEGQALIDAAEHTTAQSIPHVVIDRVQLRPSSHDALERAMQVSVRNDSSVHVDDYLITVLINGIASQHATIEVPSHGMFEQLFTVKFPHAGCFEVACMLANDKWQQNICIDRGIRVLAINGEQRTVIYDDELFFAERALGAVPMGEPPITLTLGHAIDQNLTDIDVVLLANVAALPADFVTHLAQFVQGGGGLLITLGKHINFEQINLVFKDLLPHPLRDVASVQTGDAPWSFGSLDWSHPILRDLGEAAATSLQAAHVTGYMHIDVEAHLHTHTIMRFNNGAPALLENIPKPGRGRVLLWTTSIDADLTNLPLLPVYPALLQRMLRYAAHTHASNSGLAATVQHVQKTILPSNALNNVSTSASPDNTSRGLAYIFLLGACMCYLIESLLAARS